MNIFTTVETVYLRASRTVDVILLKSFEGLSTKEAVLYIYNYEGIHYRIFKELNDFFNFLDGIDDKCVCEFDNETEMENYLCQEYEIK